MPPIVKILKLDKSTAKLPDEVLHFFEKGASGIEISGGIFIEDYMSSLTSTEAADVYDEMRRSDDQVRMLLRMVKSPIVSAEWNITPASEDDNDKLIADLIKHILFDDINNPRTGKYKTWSEFIQEAMSCVEFGYSLFEVVNKVVLNHPDYGDYIGIKDLAWRSPRTIEEWNLNSDGSINNVRQVVDGDLGRDVTISGRNLLVITPNREGDNYEGISDLRPIFGNWFRKNFLRKLQMIGIERSATGVPKGTVPTGKLNSVEHTYFEGMLKAFVNHEKNFLILPEGWTAEDFSISHNAQYVREQIVHEDVGMAKSFLANFLELGLSGKGGAYALGSDLSDIFLSAIILYPTRISEAVNHKIIKPLVDANFPGVTKYPTLYAAGINDKAGKEFAEIMKILSENDLVQKSPRLKAFLHTTFKLPEYDEEAEPEETPDIDEQLSEQSLSEVQSVVFDKSKFTHQAAKSWLVKNGFASGKTDETEMSYRFRQKDPDQYERFVTKELKPGIKAVIGFKPNESNMSDIVNLADAQNISKVIRDEAEKLRSMFMDAWKIRGEQYVADIMTVIANNPDSKVRAEVRKLAVPNRSAYSLSLNKYFAGLLSRSTMGVLSELGLPTDFKFTDVDDLGSEVPADARYAANEQVTMILEAQDAAIKTNMIATVNSKYNVYNDDLLAAQLRKVVEQYIAGASLRVGAFNSVSAMVNKARNAVFQTTEVLDQIESFIFTNDSPVAAVCKNLEGRVFTKEEYLTSDRLPPLHHNCDSYIRAQRIDRKNKPVNPLGLQFTGTENQVNAILKSKTF